MRSFAQKIAAGIFFLLAALAAFLYFLFLPRLEAEQAGQVAAFIDSLPGNLKAEAVEVNYLRREVTVRGLKGSTRYLDGSDMHVNVELLLLSGLNPDLGASAGVADVADKLVVRNGTVRTVTSAAGLDRPVRQTVVMEQAELLGLRGDAAEAGRRYLRAAPATEIFAALSTFSIASVTAQGYTNSLESELGLLRVQLRSVSSLDVTPLTIGRSVWNGFSVSGNGVEQASIQRIALERMHMPDLITPLLELEAGADEEAVATSVLTKLRGDFLEIKGLELHQAEINVSGRNPVLLEQGRFDFSLSGGDTMLLRTEIDNLEISPEAFRDLARDMSMETRRFAAYYQQPLRLRGRLDCSLQPDGDRVSLRLQEGALEDAALGAFRAELEMSMAERGLDPMRLLGDDAEILLHKAEVRLEDRALLDTFMAAEIQAIQQFGLAAGEDAPTPAHLRAATAEELRLSAADEPRSDFKKILEGLADLLERPGSLVIRLQSSEPVPFGSEDSPELDLAVHFTPLAEGNTD